VTDRNEGEARSDAGLPAPDVLGYLSQCEACGTKAITRQPHDATWNCPSCADFHDAEPVAGQTVPPVNVEYGRGYRDGLRAERRLGPPELTLLQIEDGPAYRITGPLPDDHPRAPGWYFERIPPEVEPPRLIAHAPCDLDPCSGYHCSVCGQEAVLGHICTPNTKEGTRDDKADR